MFLSAANAFAAFQLQYEFPHMIFGHYAITEFFHSVTNGLCTAITNHAY